MTLIVVVVATIVVDTISGAARRRVIEGSEVRPAPEAEVILDPALAGR
jgi:hypothetical protein